MMQIQQGNILRGSFWPEKVRVISAKTIGERQVKIEAVGLETHRFYNPILSEEDIKNTIPEATIQNEMRRKEDLERKKARLEKEIEAEVHLYPTDPMILGAVRVVAGKAHADMVSDKEIEQIGMNITTEYEFGQKRTPEDVSLQDLGYDIRSQGEVIRYIEVKARAKEGAVALTPNEWLMAQRLKEEYWLYVVTNAAFDPELYLIHNPAAKLEPDKEIDIVRYVVRNWKDKAEAVR